MREFHFDQVNPLTIAPVLEEYLNHGWEILSLDLVREDGKFYYYLILMREPPVKVLPCN